MGDQWRIDSSDWAMGPRAEDDALTHEQILGVLDQIGDVYRGALESLADTPVPGGV